MSIKILLMLIVAMIMIFAIIIITFQIYKISEIDATTRNMKRPKLNALIASANNNGSGLILYLIKRRNYPIIAITAQQQNKINYNKKVALAMIPILVVSCIMLLAILLFIK